MPPGSNQERYHAPGFKQEEELSLTNAFLLWQFTKREIQGRYRGSMLGLGWTVLSPLLLLGVFTLVFYGFFKLKWPVSATGVSQVDFALQVYVGLTLFNLFAEVVGRAPTLITQQPNLVTKVAFPLPVLALSATLSAAFQAAISLALLLTVTAVLTSPHWSWLTLPLLMALLVLLMVGVALWLSALGVYLRDLVPLVGLLTSLMMFLSPVFYPMSTVPEAWQGVYRLNPLALLITEMRGVLFNGAWPDWQSLGLLTLAIAVLLGSGAWLFERLRGGFADVL